MGKDAVDFLVCTKTAASRADAVRVGRLLSAELRIFEHVSRDHVFKDEGLFYRFVDKAERGEVSINENTGAKAGWGESMQPVFRPSLRFPRFMLCFISLAYSHLPTGPRLGS